MLRSIATVSLSGTLNEKFRACASAGFDAVEIFENDLVCSTESPETLRQMADDLGLKIALYQPFRDFEGVSDARLRQNLERARRKFDVMHRLGTDRILVCSNVAPDVVRDDSLMVDQLGALAELAREHEVLVGFEALAWGAHVNSYRHAWKLVNRVDHRHLGLMSTAFIRYQSATISRCWRRYHRAGSCSFSLQTRPSSQWTSSSGAGTFDASQGTGHSI